MKSRTSSGAGSVGETDLVEVLEGLNTSVLGERLVGGVLFEGLLHTVSTSTSEDDDIEERIGSQTVSSVHTHAEQQQ